MIALVLAVAASLFGQESAGLSGRILAKSRVEAKAVPIEIDSYSDADLQYVRRFNYAKLKNVVVYAQPIDAGSVAANAPEPATVFLKKGKVEPAFLVAPDGKYIRFKNETGEPVTLYAGGNSAGSLAVSLAPAQEKTFLPQVRGLYELYCLCGAGKKAAQSKMFVSGPYFTLADSKGRYALELPPGRYEVTAWHERLPEQVQTIELGKAEKRTLDFTLSVRQLPEIR